MTIVRAPNHLGELILALPALEWLVGARERPVRVQVVRWLLPVLHMSGLRLELVPLDDRHAIVRAALRLRRLAPAEGVLLTPSFSAALIFFLGGVKERRGTATDGRGWMLSRAIDRESLLRGHRVREFLVLAGAALADGQPPVPRLRELGRAREAWRALAARLGIPAGAAAVARTSGSEPGRHGAPHRREGGGEDSGRTVGLVPGANGPSRRWPVGRFRDLARRLARRGDRVLVFGGPGEEELTGLVAGDAPGTWDLGGRTDLWALAGGLETCDAVVSNDTGPMHMAAALDRPVVALEGPADTRQTRPLAPRTRLIGRFDLPCVPCVENECPRRGEGYILKDARRECMRLIGVAEVWEAVTDLLEEVSGDDR